MSDHISINQVLYVWSCLNRVLNKSALYGDDTVEVYVDRLLPNDYIAANENKLWKQAGKNLHSILIKFCEETESKAFVDGRKLGAWLKKYELKHKCDVRVIKANK